MKEDVVQKPEHYYIMLEDMYIDNVDISSDFEVRATLIKLNRHKKDIYDLKREINHDIRIIRSMYLDETIIEKSKFLGIISFNSKLSPTQKRKKLVLERERKLKPYIELIKNIDDYIEDIQEIEDYINNEILDIHLKKDRS